MGEKKKTVTFHMGSDSDEDREGRESVSDYVPELESKADAKQILIWHRYMDPDTHKIWFYCFTSPHLWCYQSEVEFLCQGDSCMEFFFDGQWQKVIDPPSTQPTAQSPAWQ